MRRQQVPFRPLRLLSLSLLDLTLLSLAFGIVLGVDLPAIEAEIIAQARAASGRMQALKPVLDRSKTTLDAYYRAGGHGKRVRRAH